MKKESAFWGVLLIGLGFLFLLPNIFGFDWGSIKLLWPLLLFIPGLFFELTYFKTRKKPGLLVPGGILLVLGLLFLFETFTQWHFVGYTWPIYSLSVAIGLFQFYFYSNRPRPLLVPILILCAIPLFTYTLYFFSALATWINFGFVIPAALILLGIFVLLKK